jgi:hypothetical protein
LERLAPLTLRLHVDSFLSVPFVGCEQAAAGDEAKAPPSTRPPSFGLVAVKTAGFMVPASLEAGVLHQREGDELPHEDAKISV